MKEYILSPSRKIMIFTLHEALTAAGVNETDNVFAQDAALESAFDGLKVSKITWNPLTYNEQLTELVKNGVDVVIIVKEEK